MEKVVIIGSGPAGYTAAIYAARANLSPVVIEGWQPGGQLMTTSEIENYPGFPAGLSGAELMAQMRQQAERFGAVFRAGDAVKADLKSVPKKLKLDSGETLNAQTVIIATGAPAKYLGLESEQKLIGRGVSCCATCDGAFFRDQHVAVAGDGDTALEEAEFLTRFASKVTLIRRRDEATDCAPANEKISVIRNTVVEEVFDVAKNEVTGLKLRNVRTGELSTLPVSGLFVANENQPNTGIFKNDLETDAAGYLICSGVRTAIDGVYAAGDCADPVYRQAVAAAGTGCMAAMEAERYLNSLE